MKLVKCSQCNGVGQLFLRSGRTITCDICQGTGKHESNSLWLIQGCTIKAYRFGKQIGLREMAKKFRVDPSNLSKMERGLIKPTSKILKATTEYLITITYEKECELSKIFESQMIFREN